MNTKHKVMLAVNLITAANNLLDEVIKDAGKTIDNLAEISEWKKNTMTAELSTDPHYIYEQLKKHFVPSDEKDKSNKINFRLINGRYPEIQVETDEDYLTCGLSGSDYGTWQSSISFTTKELDTIDLAMAEIKKGPLAEITGLTKDNKDIDLYLWEDVYDEDYSYHTRLYHEDIEKAING